MYGLKKLIGQGIVKSLILVLCLEEAEIDALRIKYVVEESIAVSSRRVWVSLAGSRDRALRV